MNIANPRIVRVAKFGVDGKRPYGTRGGFRYLPGVETPGY